MRVSAFLVTFGVLALSGAAAHADDLDKDARTVCHGSRCLGQYCSADGDAYNCWTESVYKRTGNEEVHYTCTKHGHHCQWIKGPLPDSDSWNVIQLSTQ